MSSRPIKQVDIANPALRAVWWNPVPTSPLPSWKVWAVVAFFALAALGINPIVGLLIIAGAIAFVVMKRRANAVPVEATSLDLIREEISKAIVLTVNQVGPDLGITGEEFKDALAQKLLLVNTVGEEQTYNQAAGVYRRIQTYVAIITPKGLGYLTGFYNTIDATFSPGTRELVLWKKVGRVVISSNALEINVFGSSITIPLDESSRVVSPGFGDSITELVNPFVREAQKRLEANA